MTCIVLLDIMMDWKLQISSGDFQFYLQKPSFTPDNEMGKNALKASYYHEVKHKYSIKKKKKAKELK